MRILIATWSSRLVGGTETYLGRIMPLLAAAGHEIAFVYELDEPANRPRVPLPEGATSCPLVSGGPDESLRAIVDWRPDVIFVHGLLDPTIEERLQQIAPAVFFGHTYYGTCISGDKTCKFPVVQPCDRLFGPACLALYFPRRCGGLSAVTMVREYAKQRRRFSLLGRYAAVVTGSEHMCREFLRHGAARGRVFNCSFPLEAANRPNDGVAARASPSPGAPWRLAFLGRMDRLKGGTHLLEALPRVRNSIDRPIHLSLGGDGPDRPAWERHARDVMRRAPDVHVEFAGWLHQAQLTSLLDLSDLVVMPSLWPEPYGLVGSEAHRRGVPVVAYATGGIPEWLVEGVNGCLAPGDPPTVDGLAQAIVRCLGQLSSGDALRKGALATSDSRSDRAHVSALLEVLREAAGQPLPASGRAADVEV
ncbi:MAG: glycosyltransferase family 4 protein [Vicinamibacterales bacterium]